MALDPRVEILKTLRATPVILRTLVRDLGNEDAQRKPSPGEWAVIEVVAHMADTDQRAVGRVTQIVDDEDPELSAFDQDQLAIDDGYLGRDLAAELDRYEMGRRDHVSVLERLRPSDWRRLGRHAEHGAISVELYETHVAAEDVDHLSQIARLVSNRRATQSDP